MNGVRQCEPLLTHAGVPMPRLIYGTAWKAERTAALVEAALRAGFRGIDTAAQPKHYFEAGVGVGLANVGLPRAALYLQTKFTPPDGQDSSRLPYALTAPLDQQIAQSVASSLHNLATDYLDALVLHSPLASRGCDLARVAGDGTVGDAWRRATARHQ